MLKKCGYDCKHFVFNDWTQPPCLLCQDPKTFELRFFEPRIDTKETDT